MLVVGCDLLVEQGWRRIEDLERRWSRFLPGSEVSQLNRYPERPVVVSADTYLLVDRAVTAWRATDSLFDPTVLDAITAIGYDRSFERVPQRVIGPAIQPQPPPGCDGILLEPSLNAITLPRGVAIDPGGIGKGLAADLVVTELMSSGAEGALVNIGGDVRVAGAPPSSDRWSIRVDHPLDPDRELARIGLREGAVVTSSRLKRRWIRSGDEVHHLIDPRSGESTSSNVVAATVVSGEAWWAEAQTKPIFVLGAHMGLQRLTDSSGLVVTDDGGVTATPNLELP